MTSRVKRGYNFENIFRRSFIQAFPDGYIYKIPDMHSISGQLSEIHKYHSNYTGYAVPKSPADFICVIGGRTVWVECKSTRNLTSFPLRNIKDHQIETGLEIDAAGGIFYFAIRRDEPYKSRMWLVPVNELIKVQQELAKTAKSIKWHLLERHGIECKRIKNSMFDLEKMNR